MWQGESQGNQDTTTYITIPNHNIQSMTQGMAQALCVSEHFHHVIGSDDCFPDWLVQFYVSHYPHTRSTLSELRRCFLKKMIINVREESRVRERNFKNFQAEERMKCRCKCLWCFDDDHDDMMQLMQMGFSSLNSKQYFKNTSHNIKMITSILGREFLIELAKGLAK
ncbi:Phosphoglycerate mutase-like protein AT74 [Glycine max]|nr:Phosphoglycerate mutase-like protein AT74 [Glycine max]